MTPESHADFGPVSLVWTSLPISRTTAYKLLDDGVIASVRIRGTRWVVTSSLNEYRARLLLGEAA